MAKRDPSEEQKKLRAFIDELEMNVWDKYLYLGIDPGAEGAVALLCGKYSYVFDIPTKKEKRGKKKVTIFDNRQIVTLFKIIERAFTTVKGFRAMVEKIQPNYGGGQGSAYSQFRIGCAYAMWPLFLEVMGFNVKEEYPSVWKRKMGLMTKRKGGDKKGKSLKMARKYFPNAPLDRKMDHNRAEALLITEYGRRVFKGA